jgi:hypothetical protein
MRKVLAVAGLLATGISILGPAEAATFKPIEKGRSLVMSGDIVAGDNERMIAAFNASCRKHGYCPSRIFLNSPGGEVVTAFKVGATLLERRSVDTVVGPTDTCASACFIIFSAGRTRAIFPTSKIGVHSASIYNQPIKSLASTIEVAHVLRVVGVPEGIIMKVLTTGPNQMAWIHPEDNVNGWMQELELTRAMKRRMNLR